MSLKQCYCRDQLEGDKWRYVAYSAVSLNEKPMDSQSIRENLVKYVSRIWVALVAG